MKKLFFEYNMTILNIKLYYFDFLVFKLFFKFILIKYF